ncbi:MAG: DUF1674 domain-containing protein [Alphaproteobacteria bacterium]|nr:DUF1674 domain-containing protein [Alphaproteobacteria bacterium]MCY4231682.1 DUF1674 domain-containing protein [Alphaproteobacteria bacterium]
MSYKSRPPEPKTHDSVSGPASGGARQSRPDDADKPDRPDPTRYGDWEVNGRCIDF